MNHLVIFFFHLLLFTIKRERETGCNDADSDMELVIKSLGQTLKEGRTALNWGAKFHTPSVNPGHPQDDFQTYIYKLKALKKERSIIQ